MGKKKISEGMRFGFLTAKAKVRASTASWLCLCFCGNEINVRSANLLSGKTKSCGCMSSAMRNDSYYNSRPHLLDKMKKGS